MNFLFGGGGNSSNKDFGGACILLARICGTAVSLMVLLCGLISLLPLPSLTTSLSDYPRCFGVAFIFIVMSIIMFFMEVTIMGQCVEKLAFLTQLTKYLKNWHRSVVYMGMSIAPLVLWCLSASTIIPMVLLFLTGALNFVLAIGQKGDHSEQLVARWRRLKTDDKQDEEDSDEEEHEDMKTDTQTSTTA